MTVLKATAVREVRMGFRSPWAITFLVLFSGFNLALLGIESDSAMGLKAYTHPLGTMMNLILDLLPLMTLLLGSLSLAGEKEDGGRDLLAAYALSPAAYLGGKAAGLLLVLAAILAAGLGVYGTMGALGSSGVHPGGLLVLGGFSFALVVLYLTLALVIGAWAADRWQALTMSVGVWFLTVLAWPTLIIAFLNLLPYSWIAPALAVLECLNPAELVRVGTVLAMGEGGIFGPSYLPLVERFTGPAALWTLTGAAAAWAAFGFGAAAALWERRRGGE